MQHELGQLLKTAIEQPKAAPSKALDSAEELAESTLAEKSVELSAIGSVQQWIETDEMDLDEGEGMGDRLFALVAGIADEDMDGEISEDEADIMDTAMNAIGDYLSSAGVPDSDIDALFSEFDNDVAEAIHSQLTATEDAGEEIATFVEGDGSDESAMDATYKKKLVIRKGKKVWARKRVAGRVRLSSKQKLGLKKARRKAQTGIAKLHRRKSMAKRRSMIRK